jgi:hypothetical protein
MDIQGRAEEFLVAHIVDEWVKEAREDAMADIAQETAEHEWCVRKTFRE